MDEGSYTLRISLSGKTADQEITVGAPAPEILNVDADDHLSAAWTATVETSMAGTLAMTVSLEDGEKDVLTQSVPAGESEIAWDGTVDGEMLPEGDWELTLRLMDDTGFSSNPQSLNVLYEEAPAPQLATDVTYHKPNENSAVKCDHDICYWKLNMGEMDEDAIWQVLIQPVTVLSGEQRQLIKVRSEPDEACTDYVGEVTCASQAVHVLDRGEEWTLIEAYSSSVSGSKVAVWAAPFQGYVQTSLLEEKQVSQEYGIVVDKLQQRLYLFKEGKLFSTLLCSTGYPTKKAPYNETPAGEFLIVSWTGGFWSGNMFCDLALRINGGILLHEVPCFVNEEDGSHEYGNFEPYLGEKASHGCIRVQQQLSPEGVNMRWLWDNLNRKENTKVIIWDEVGRILDYPADDVTLYYNPEGGKQYHSCADCPLVKQAYLPLTPFLYGELDDEPYSKLTRCPGCSPQLRREEIDEVNEKNTRTLP